MKKFGEKWADGGRGNHVRFIPTSSRLEKLKCERSAGGGRVVGLGHNGCLVLRVLGMSMKSVLLQKEIQLSTARNGEIKKTENEQCENSRVARGKL